MNKIWTSINKNKKLYTLVICFLTMGLIIGIYYFTRNKTIIDKSIYLNYLQNNNLNNILFHVSILSICITFNFIIIGTLFFALLFIYEGISIGYSIATFFSAFNFNGFLYALITNILLKGIYLFLLVVLFNKLFKLCKALILCYCKKHSIDGDLFLSKIKNILYIFLFIILNDIVLYFLGNKILYLFKFLLN